MLAVSDHILIFHVPGYSFRSDFYSDLFHRDCGEDEKPGGPHEPIFLTFPEGDVMAALPWASEVSVLHMTFLRTWEALLFGKQQQQEYVFSLVFQ